MVINSSISSVKFLALLLLIISTLSGCAETVKITKKVQPKIPEAAELRRVAFMGFRGRNAGDVNVAFEAMLVGHRFDGVPYFTVVDRDRTKELMKEYQRALSGEISPSTAARFGRQIGVNGIYFGDITDYKITSDRYRAKQSYCQKYNSDGTKCKQAGMRDVTCTQRNAIVTIAPRLVDVETGRVIYRTLASGNSKASACPGSTIKPDNLIIGEAIARAVAQIRADIAPNEVAENAVLMEKPSILDRHELEKFESGMAFAKEERMDRACEIWRSLNSYVQSSDNALLYNVALCEEIDGNYVEAYSMLELIDRRLTRPERLVTNSLNRLKSSMSVE